MLLGPQTTNSSYTVAAYLAHGASHEGVHKTFDRLRASFYSPHANRLVSEFVQGCVICQRNKTEHLHRLLELLEVPRSIGVSRHCHGLRRRIYQGGGQVGGYHSHGSLLQVRPLHCSWPPVHGNVRGRIFLDNIVRLHDNIVSNRDLAFTSTFWMELVILSSIDLRLSSAFHPKTDGQSELAKRVLGVYLRCLAGDHPCSCYVSSGPNFVTTLPIRLHPR